MVHQSTQVHGSLAVGEQHLAPRLRPKPSSTKLRSTATQSTVVTSPQHLYPPAFNRSRTDVSVPRTTNPNNTPLDADTSIFTRRERRPSQLPTPVERSTTPIQRPRTGPPTKDHRVFSNTSVGSSGVSSDAEKKVRRVVKKKNSAASSDRGYTLGNGSTTSLSTSGSSHFASRNTSQTSVLGITLPSTSASSTSSLLHVRQRSGSGNVPRLLTQDLPVSLDSLGAACDSSPSTRYTDSPFSHSSTPTSASSHSPGPAAMLRTISSSPRRPPVTKKRTGSTASVTSDIGLDSVRESTSTSSGSTVRADKSRSTSKSSEPRTPTLPQFTTPSTPSTKITASPQLPSSAKTTSSTTASSRVRWGSNATPARPSKETVTGLGVSIPGTMTTTTAASHLIKTRSRSISSSFGQQKTRKDTATPPLQSSGLAPQRNVPRVVAQGLTYTTIPPLGGTGEQEATPNSEKLTPSMAKPGFFSRGRAKSEEKSSDKLTKRGPAAGTGYEGYGSFGKASRGRSGSSPLLGDRNGTQTSMHSRSTSGSRSGSQNSLEMDEFLMERLKPVVMVGGEVVENQNRAADMVRSGSSPAILEVVSDSQQREDLLRIGGSLGVHRRVISQDDRAMVAGRRDGSPARSRTPMPPPINTAVSRARPVPSPVLSIRSRKQSLDAPDATPVSAKPKSKRWNFFQKSQSKAATGSSLAVPPATPPTVASVPEISRSTSKRHVPHEPAHYALLDREEQREAQEYVERMHELRQKRAVSNETPSSTPSYTHALRKQQSFQITDSPKASSQNTPNGKGPMLLPPYRTVKKLTKAPASRVGHSPGSATVTAKSEVPRIRTVVPQQSGEQGSTDSPRMRRDPSPEEFQIGWNWRGLTPTSAPSGLERSKDFVEYDPLDPRGRRPAPATPFEDGTPNSTPYIGNGQWGDRNDSIASIAQGDVETPISGTTDGEEHPFALEDLVVDAQLGEDFYSELEGQYGIPHTPAAATFAPPPAIKRTDTIRSTTSSLGSPFQYADHCSPLQVDFDSPKSEQEEFEAKEQSPKSATYSPDSPTLPPLPPPRPVPDEIPIISLPSPLGPDQPLPFTPPAQNLLSPATPFSITSFINCYEESDAQRAISMVEPLVYKLDGPEDIESRTHRATGSNGSNMTTSSISSTTAAENEMRIRPLALLASRWLSFDRVLISPAHQTLKSGSNGRVLVVDGLGIDDWSFYCAHSYPSAKVYNLAQTPFPPSQGGRQVPASPSVPRPPNHHQIYTPSLATSFPFPKGFFSVICFRFLPSSSDGHWSFILSECKRVLQPGGHLEVTLLDADLMNAGPRAQRAVDLVKAIMQRENPTEGSAYRPASEKVLRILGKKGFEDMSKCFVGLPAVGKVDSHSEMEQGERERSPDDPESINEVVSQVGRYWYTRCYEGVITAQGEHMQRSMWHDRGLLRECRKRRTNFKMMVCCARKPLSARRGSDAVSTTTASAPAAAAATTPA